MTTIDKEWVSENLCDKCIPKMEEIMSKGMTPKAMRRLTKFVMSKACDQCRRRIMEAR